MRQTLTPASIRHRIAPAVFAFSLLLGACSISTSTSRRDIPPPPTTPFALDEPESTGPVFASRQLVPVAATERGTEGELLAFLERWREAWVKGDFQGYIAHYAPAYSGENTAALRWQTRHHRMVQGTAGQGRLSVGEPNIEIEGNGRAQMSFPQHFQGAGMVEIGTKQWQLRQVNGRWQIQQEIFERSGP